MGNQWWYLPGCNWAERPAAAIPGSNRLITYLTSTRWKDIRRASLAVKTLHSMPRRASSKPCFSRIVPLHVADIGSNGWTGSVVSRCRSRGDDAALSPGRVTVHGEVLLQRRRNGRDEDVGEHTTRDCLLERGVVLQPRMHLRERRNSIKEGRNLLTQIKAEWVL